MEDKPIDWPYAVGRFVCHRCGNCCRGDGYVKLTADDIRRASAFLGLEEAEFLATHGVREGDHWVLRDQADADLSCIFLLPDNTCRIYPAKPTQCRDFPLRWRGADAIEFCAGLRAGLALPPPTRRTMAEPPARSPKGDGKAK